MNYPKLSNPKLSSEILYSLQALHEYGWNSSSKIAIQKIIYLSTALSFYRNILFSCHEFYSWYRGPYSKKIQNTLDHLVALNFVKVKEIVVQEEGYTLAEYELNAACDDILENLKKYEYEKAKYSWIQCLIKYLTRILRDEEFQQNSSSSYKGLDKIVDLVYAEPTFLKSKVSDGTYKLIDLDYKLLEFDKWALDPTESKPSNFEGTMPNIILEIKEYFSHPCLKNNFQKMIESRDIFIYTVLTYLKEKSLQNVG